MRETDDTTTNRRRTEAKYHEKDDNRLQAAGDGHDRGGRRLDSTVFGRIELRRRDLGESKCRGRADE